MGWVGWVRACMWKACWGGGVGIWRSLSAKRRQGPVATLDLGAPFAPAARTHTRTHACTHANTTPSSGHVYPQRASIRFRALGPLSQPGTPDTPEPTQIPDPLAPAPWGPLAVPAAGQLASTGRVRLAAVQRRGRAPFPRPRRRPVGYFIEIRTPGRCLQQAGEDGSRVRLAAAQSDTMMSI